MRRLNCALRISSPDAQFLVGRTGLPRRIAPAVGYPGDSITAAYRPSAGARRLNSRRSPRREAWQKVGHGHLRQLL